MSTDSDQRLLALDLLGDDEFDELYDWGNRDVLFDGVVSGAEAGVSIPELFARQVAVIPDVVALRYNGASVSYRELDEASNRLAYVLVSRGAGPGARVGLLLPRTADGVIAILAVLKTGAAYVPVDPAHPDERVAFVFDDAEPIAVITTADQRDRLAGRNVEIIDIDDQAVAQAPATPLKNGPAQDDIAHIIYTSGTTGKPKGCAVTHHNVTRLLEGLDSGLPRPGVWALCHSLAFDWSVAEIWGALLHGGRLVVVPEEVTTSPEEFHALLVAEKVTGLNQTPSAVGALSPEGLESMALVVGAEACPPELVDRWATPGRVMLNVYGPTEATIYSTLSAPLSAGSATVPIGTALPGSALFVLDGWLRPVPVGVVGELYVAGAGV
ncbi:non-ribosomal peptide synthetase, partial [Mycolicibacterium insubricum]